MGLRFSAPRRFGKCLLACGLLGIALTSSCQDDSKSVSSSLFPAPITRSSLIEVIASKLDFLRAVNPNELDSVLAEFPAEGYAFGRLSEYDGNVDTLREVDDLLVYESQTGSILSARMNARSQVLLHYNKAGLDEEQSRQGAVTAGGSLSLSVPPIRLKNGWILAYDSRSANILAFRKEAPRLIQDGDQQFLQAFRPFPAKPTVATKNFGVGNGLLMSLVSSRQELALALKVPSPVVTRFFEIEPNKVLLFFSTVRAIHLLDLEEQTVEMVWDLADEANPAKRVPTKLLRGDIQLFPVDPTNPESPLTNPFLTFTTISTTITGSSDVKVDAFQPIAVPLSATTRPALVFERTTSQFIHVFPLRRNPADLQSEIIAGAATRAIISQTILSALQQGTGGNVVTPPLDFRTAFYFQGRPGICLFDEKTNNCLLYDYTAPIASNLSVFVQASSVIQPRIPGGGTSGTTQAEPVLRFAVNDVDDNRLAFDSGQDQMLTISYSTGLVVVAADRQTITTQTGASLADLTYIEALTDVDVRAFDTAATALLKVVLEYNAFPIQIK